MGSLTVIPPSPDRFQVARAADAYRAADGLRPFGRRPAPPPVEEDAEFEDAPRVDRGFGGWTVVLAGSVAAGLVGMLLGGALAV